MSVASLAIGVAISPFICAVVYVVGYLTKKYIETPGYSYKPIPNTTTEPFLDEKYFRWEPGEDV
tara:strand:+ start:126 stop:317 length:192 start_codon:yes stop_codon:yes gene_type:complete